MARWWILGCIGTHAQSRGGTGRDNGRPRILLLTPDFPPAPGGIQLVMHRIAELASRVTIRVIARDHPQARAWDAHGGLDVRRAKVVPGIRRAGLVTLNTMALLDARTRRPDAILCGHIVAAPAALFMARRTGVPVLVYLHADEGPAQPRLARLAFSHASRTIAVSRYTRDLAISLGAPDKRVALIPPGVDLPAATRAERSDEPLIVTVARLTDQYKGHDTTLEALSGIRARVPGARWVVVGDGPLRPKLDARARELGVADAVSFVGRVSDEERDAWLDRARVFVMPSRLPPGGAGGEGFGIAYLEAGAHGLPVVAGAVAGALDAVVDGETGLLVDPQRSEAVAEAVAGLLLDPGRAQSLGRAGAERAAEFSWGRMVTRVEDEILETIGQA